MELTIARDDLRALITAVSPAVMKKTTLPALNHILLTASPAGLVASATNLDMYARAMAPVREVTDGAALVPADLMRAIAGKLPRGDARLKLNGTGTHITAGRSKMKVATLPATEFPAFPEVSFADCWTVPAALLWEMIDATAFAASDEETRPILNGVLVHVVGSEMRMNATDGHRLAMAAAPAPDGAAAFVGDGVIVHPSVLRMAKAMLSGAEVVEVARGDNWIAFRAGESVVTGRLIEGPYPDYDRVIPKDNDKTLVVEGATFAASLERVAVVAAAHLKEGYRRVRLTLGPGEPARLSTTSKDAGVNEGDDEVPCEYAGDPLAIELNIAYALDSLIRLPDGPVRWTFSTPTRAVVLTPEDAGGGPRILHLIMPLRILD